ncbi:MAG: hypothetical protein LQ341_003448 [Variospora aurantia]|nr:MAG: hypothetical protein LQ341_003448 [Variospora aurantia]
MDNNCGIEPANLIGSSTLEADVPVHRPSKHKRSGSPAFSPPAHLVPSPKTQPTASQIALRKRLHKQDLTFREYIARKTSADEDSGSATDNLPDSSSDSDSSQPGMATSPDAIRKELADNFMFIGRGHLIHPDNVEFMHKIMKVMKSDRKSAVSEQDIQDFEEIYKTYKLSNEATLTFMLVPILMKSKFTAQEVNQNGEPCGEFKTRGFIQQGVITSVDRLFKPYCLPHALMNTPDVPRPMIQHHFDKSKALTTPKPDFSYGVSEDKLPKAPSDIAVSETISSLLKLAPVHEIFFVWENKSGGGILMKCENQALKDVSAVIYAKRQLYEHIGQANTPGIDKQTFVYAATNDNRRLDFWVAYAWIPEDLSRVEFHMEKIGSIDFSIDELERDPNTLANIRKPLHNIVEWGSVTKIPDLERFYNKLWEVERGVFDRSLEEAREEAAKADAEGSSKKKKKKIY